MDNRAARGIAFTEREMRKLLGICITVALAWGSAGGALAAALCPHEECRAAFASGRAEPTQEQPGAGHCHEPFAATVEHSGAEHSDAHGAARAEESDAGEVDGRARREGLLCAHCAGSPGPPAAPAAGRGLSRERSGDATEAPPRPLAAPPRAVPLVREVIPSQGAPPGHVPRHVLHGVFLI